MKKGIYSIFALVLLIFASCTEDDYLGNAIDSKNTVRISVKTTSRVVTRANTVEDTDLENRIDWIDVFVFNANDEKTVFHKERIDVSSAPVHESGEFTLAKKRVEFGEDTPYYVYVVANAKANLVSNEAGIDNWSDLQALVQNDYNIHLTAFVDEQGSPAFTDAPERFLMDGFVYLTAESPSEMGTCIINDPEADNVLLSGTLNRAAAKFIINIKQGANVEFKQELKDYNGQQHTPQYYINQLPISTRVLPQAATDYYQPTTQNTATVGLNPYTLVWNKDNSMTITGYGYADDWSELEYTKQTSMVFNLPMLWDKDKNADNGKEESLADNWYKIPLSKEKKFDRNTCYIINITVNAVGAEEKEYAIELKDIEYITLPWEEVTMDLGGYGAAFLTLNTDLVKIYNTNIDANQLTFTSSSPIVSIKLKDTFSHNEQSGSFEQGGAVIGADGLPTGEYTGTDGVYAYYIDKFGQKIQLGADPGFDIKVVEQPSWTKEQILAKELNLWDAKQTDAEGNNILDDNGDPISKDSKDQYIRAEVWDEHKRALNGNITIHSPILPVAENEDLNWPSHFNTVRYLEFEVTNEQGIKAIFRVEQMPSITILHEEGFFSYRSDMVYTEEQETASHYLNYIGGKSFHLTGLYWFHEHEWSKEFDQTEEWWETNRNDRSYSWVVPSTCPANQEASGVECVHFSYLANAIKYTDASGKVVDGLYAGSHRTTVPPIDNFVRWRYKGIAATKMDAQGAAIGPIYQKSDGKWYRKHYVWDVQPIFYNMYVTNIYRENDDANNIKKGQAKIHAMYHKTPAQNMFVDSPGTGWAPWRTWTRINNHRMYNVNTTTPQNNYTSGYPTMTAEGDVKNVPHNAIMISPNLQVASQLGETFYQSVVDEIVRNDYGYIIPQVGVFYKMAEEHCRQYVEATYIHDGTDEAWYLNPDASKVVHYDDWRLPTKAEIDKLIELQQSSRALDKLLTGKYYFCITGNGEDADINVKENWVSNPVPDYVLGNEGYYIRCVRDVNRKK